MVSQYLLSEGIRIKYYHSWLWSRRGQKTSSITYILCRFFLSRSSAALVVGTPIDFANLSWIRFQSLCTFTIVSHHRLLDFTIKTTKEIDETHIPISFQLLLSNNNYIQSRYDNYSKTKMEIGNSNKYCEEKEKKFIKHGRKLRLIVGDVLLLTSFSIEIYTVGI